MPNPPQEFPPFLPPLVAGATIALAGGALAAWFFWGWDLAATEIVWGYLPEFPLSALIAAAIAAFAIAALTGSGHVLLARRRSARISSGTNLALSFLLGASAIGAVGSYVSYLLLFPGLLFLLAVPFLFFLRPERVGLPHSKSPIQWLTLLLVLLVFLAALVPAVESDGLRYHLVTALEWERAGRFVNIPYSANSNLPALQSLLAAMASGRESLGRVYQLLHAAHLAALVVLAAAAAAAVARSFGARDKALIPYASLLVVSIPVVAVVGAWPFSDIASVAYLLGAIVVMIPGAMKRKRDAFAAGSLLLGASVAMKLSTLPLACLIGLWAFAQVFRGRSWAGSLALLLIPGALVLAPWLFKSAIHHGNPVYPLAHGIFGGPEWSEANAEFYQSKVREKGVGHGAVDLLRSPWDVTVNWEKFEQHNPGPALLALLPIALLAGGLACRRLQLQSPALPFLLLLIPGWLIWFFSYQSVRFLVPQILAVLVLGTALLNVLAVRLAPAWRTALHAALLALAAAGASWTIYYQLAVVPVYQAAVGRINEELYISARFNGYPGVMWLQENTEENEPVFYIGEHRGMYAWPYRPILSDWFDTPRVLVEIRETEDNAELLTRWREEGIRHVLLNQAELRLYEETYFRHRFSEEEWTRFVKLRNALMENVVFDSGGGVFVLRVD